MKKEAPNENRLDEQEITRAAQAAVEDLQLEVEVKSVAAEGERWCVQFTADYNQFCDSFRDQFGKANSFELIREKIKRHILKQQQSKIRAGVRVRRAKPKPSASSDSLLETAWKTIEGAVSQTAEAAGEIVNQALSLPEQALTAIAAAPPQTLMRVTVKPAARKATRKSLLSPRKTTGKKAATTRKSASRKKKPAATKRAATKRTATKSNKKSASKSSKKSATKASKKRGATKKGARGK